MLDLFGNEVNISGKINLKKNKDGSFKENPCIPVYGSGPDGQKCKNCIHFVIKKYSGKYFKCDLRKNNNSPSTDHRANWPSCGKFERRENEN